jgi:hypothetical protein
MSVTNLSANNISVTSITVGNASAYNVSILNASVNSITVGNASTYNVSIYNASITNLSASNANIYNVISPNIDASATQLSIGGTTATSLVLGKAANTTNILGNLKINSDSGTLGQVLTSNGNNTVPTWNSLSSVGFGWVGTATSNLSMGTYSIIGSILDSSGTNLSIGGTTAESVILGRATKVTNILGNLQIAGSAGAAGKVLTSNATTAVWSDTSWVGTATSNLSMGTNSIICSNIDASATSLTIGGVTAQGLTLGKALTDTNILGNLKIAGNAGTLGQVLRSTATTAEWVDYGTATANLAMGIYSITGTSLDSATTLTLGGTTATTTTLGRIAVGTTTNINGLTVNISGTTINLGVNTSSSSIINVGTFQFLGDVLGSTINVIDGSMVNVSGVMRIADKLTAGAIRMGSALTTGNIIIGSHNSTGNTDIRTGGVLQLGNQATTVNIGATTGTTNTIQLGNADSTTTISGVTTNFQATTNTFTNLSANNVSIINASIGNLSATNISVNSITASNASMFNVSVLNFSARNISVNSITISNASISNITLGPNQYINMITNSINPTNNTNALGSIYTFGTITNSTSLSATPIQATVSNNSLPIGVYILNGNITISSLSSGNNEIQFVRVSIGKSTAGDTKYGTFRLGRGTIVNQTASNINQSVFINSIVNITTSELVYVWISGLAVTNSLLINVNASTNNIPENYIKAVRIA